MVVPNLAFLNNQDEGANCSDNYANKLCDYKFTNKQRRQLQHEFKNHLEKYFKDLLGKGLDYTKVTIWDDMVIIRGERFLTETEKVITQTSKGCELVNEARMQVVHHYIKDNLTYFEEKLGAKCIHHAHEIDSKKDYWVHLMIFDQLLIDQ